MWRRKEETVAKLSYEEELRKRMEEQFDEKRKRDGTVIMVDNMDFIFLNQIHGDIICFKTNLDYGVRMTTLCSAVQWGVISILNYKSVFLHFLV